MFLSERLRINFDSGPRRSMGISTTSLYNSALFVTVLERYVERSERMRIERLEVSLSDQQAQPTRTRWIKTRAATISVLPQG
jgi:hypothetical protein